MGETYKVVITERAQRSLERILNYLAKEYSEETAERNRERIMKAILSLENMPSGNPPAKGIVSEKKIVYRRIMAKKYRIIYTIKENLLQVLVVEIHHSNQGDPSIYEGFE